MSEVSVLAHEYRAASDLSQALNRAVITLKRAAMNLPGRESLTPAQVEASCQDVIETLETLIVLLQGTHPQSLSVARRRSLPAAMIAKLRKQRRGTLEYYVRDLEQVIQHVQIGPPAVTPEDIALLDELAAAADAEASNVFQRMMRI